MTYVKGSFSSTAAREKIVLGLWPIAGITTLDVTELAAKETIAAAMDHGITAFDTAYSYGYEGQSDRWLGQAIGSHRERYFVIGKVGQRWQGRKQRVIDGSPATLVGDAEASLKRMKTDYFDLLMLHCPDPNVPIEQSAAALMQLHQRGLCHKIGVCNVDNDQRQQFQNVAPCQAIQCPLNLLQRDNLTSLIRHCESDGCEVYTFWTLMKGLLAGAIERDHRFDPRDVRPSYPVFQGSARQRAHQLLDRLKAIGEQWQLTVAQLAIGWVMSQPGVTAALVGARYPDQIAETAATPILDAALIRQIEIAISKSE